MCETLRQSKTKPNQIQTNQKKEETIYVKEMNFLCVFCFILPVC